MQFSQYLRRMNNKEMIKRLLEASKRIHQQKMQGDANFIHIPLQQIEQWAKDEGTTTEEMIKRLEKQLNPNN